MQKRTVRRAVAAGLSTLAIAGTTMTLSAGTASADTPWPGALCTAGENIQFYNQDFNPSYTVQAGEFIRVVDVWSPNWATGHGSGHSNRYFVYRHSDGRSRLFGCH